MVEFIRVSPALAIWHTYDTKIKAELFSTVLASSGEVTIIDPIALRVESREEIELHGRVSAIVITNANHLRNAAAFAHFYYAPIFASAELKRNLPHSHALAERTCIDDLQVIRIDGAAPGEFALYHPEEGGTLIIGDALINFDPHGFTLLPAKYCCNQKKMICSLRRLLDFQFQRILFAHGNPVTTRAHDRLAALMEEKL